MQRLPNIHPNDTSKYPNANGVFNVGAADAGAKILIYNQTPLNLQLDFYNGATDTLHSWEANYWVLDGDTKEIGWSIDIDSLNVAQPPIETIFLTLYSASEKIPGTYPMALINQITVGNPGGTPSNVSNLQNTGNAPGTNVVSVGSTGATGNTWTVSNDGLVSMFVTIAAALVQVLKTNASDPILQLGAAAHLIEILGNLQLDGSLAIGGKVTSINGGIAGTATLYEILVGTVKLSLVYLNGFRTDGSIQNLVFGTPYTTRAKVWTNGIPGNSQFLSGGVAQNVDIVTALAAGGGSNTTQNNISTDSIASITSGFDTFSFPANNNQPHTGLTFLIGI